MSKLEHVWLMPASLDSRKAHSACIPLVSLTGGWQTRVVTVSELSPMRPRRPGLRCLIVAKTLEEDLNASSNDIEVMLSMRFFPCPFRGTISNEKRVTGDVNPLFRYLLPARRLMKKPLWPYNSEQ